MSSSQLSEASKEFFFFPILNKSYRTHTIPPAARGDLLADCTPCTQWGNMDTRLWASRWSATRNSLSMHGPDICKLLSHLNFFRKIALIQSSVRKGGRQQLHTFTHDLDFKKQQGSGRAESSAGISP